MDKWANHSASIKLGKPICIIHVVSASDLLLLSSFVPADPRNTMRPMDAIHLDPSFHLKPALPERPVGSLPPKPPIVVKPPIPSLAASAEGFPSFAPPSSSSADKVHLRAHTHDSRQEETTAQVIQQFPHCLHCFWEGYSNIIYFQFCQFIFILKLMKMQKYNVTKMKYIII